jgi:hypothetical protein
MENFFSLYGKKCHETGIYYLMEFDSPKSRYLSTDEFYGVEYFSNLIPGRTIQMTFRWISPEDFDQVEIRPVTLRKHLQSIPDRFTRIVNAD